MYNMKIEPCGYRSGTTNWLGRLACDPAKRDIWFVRARHVTNPVQRHYFNCPQCSDSPAREGPMSTCRLASNDSAAWPPAAKRTGTNTSKRQARRCLKVRSASGVTSGDVANVHWVTISKAAANWKAKRWA